MKKKNDKINVSVNNIILLNYLVYVNQSDKDIKSNNKNVIIQKI